MATYETRLENYLLACSDASEQMKLAAIKAHNDLYELIDSETFRFSDPKLETLRLAYNASLSELEHSSKMRSIYNGQFANSVDKFLADRFTNKE